jgi:hypothetical protein
MHITFTNVSGVDVTIDKPIPASQAIPEWYKSTLSYISGEKKPKGNGEGESTIKKCMPVFDSMTSGYLILLPADIYVSPKEGEPYFQWSNLGLISFHVFEQAPIHPMKNGFNYPKLKNPWAIKTPKGYSCLIMQPTHRDLPFNIFPAVVDTDTYTDAINFPFVLKDPNFEGLIPAGTPIAQIMPFKRESWKMQIGNEKDLIQTMQVANKLQRKFFDRYKTMFWTKKEYT